MKEALNDEIDVVFGGRVLNLPAWLRTAVNPIRLGASIGHRRVTADALGCFAEDSSTHRLGVLSNNHVLANANTAAIGDPVWQPGRADGGTSDNQIGTLQKFEQIQFAGAVNYTDCAWADLAGVRYYSLSDLTDSGDVRVGSITSSSSVTLQLLDVVVKMGRTTGYTQGKVTAVNVANLNVRIRPNLHARFDDVVQIESVTGNAFWAVETAGRSSCLTMAHLILCCLLGPVPVATTTKGSRLRILWT